MTVVSKIKTATYTHPPGSVWKRDRDSIMRHFNWMNFRDPVGHPLTLCADFMDIIDELALLRQAVGYTHPAAMRSEGSAHDQN